MDICICARCKKVFWEDEMSSHGSYCKPCMTDIVKEWRSNNHERHLESVRAWHRNHSEECNEKSCNKRFLEPEKVKAVNDLNHAVEGGRIIRQPCEVCGVLPTHAHHEDYGKPLEVRWLCPVHHKEAHRVKAIC